MLRISHIVKNSFVDGQGERTVLFVKGCTLDCDGCQNKHLQPHMGGKMMDEENLARHLANITPHHQYTLSGGDPTEQAEAVAKLLVFLREFDPAAHVIMYSGYLFEDIPHILYPLVDIIVDGRFVRSLDNPLIAWRGSTNQRVIDVPATIQTGEIVQLNWDNPQIIIPADGSLLMPIGMLNDFQEIGDVAKTRRCGQTQ